MSAAISSLQHLLRAGSDISILPPWLTKECRETKMAFGRLMVAFIVLGVLAFGAQATQAQRLPPAKDSLAGKLLVASKRMRDPNFAETVIYICRHDASGAFGLVLNRGAGEVSLADVLRSFQIEGQAAVGVLALRHGGPVQRDAGFILHTSEFQAGTRLCSQGGLAVSSGREILDALAAGKRPEQAVLFFGYAGWGAGQLERELGRKDWITVAADRAIIFGPETKSMWRRALRRRGIDL
jgi:putative transcriptional regulator